MSFQIDTAFVNQFRSNVMFLLQQMGTKLRGFVRNETQNGELSFYEQIGPVDMVQRITRHGDSPLVSTPHARRAVTMLDYEWGDLIDKEDKVRLLIEPQSAYAQNAAMAMARQIDRTIIAAFNASALTGKAGTTTVALPATQIIQATGTDTANSGGGSTNLILAKLRRAKFLLDDAHVPEDDRYIVIGANQMQSLLNKTAITSADFNTVKALVQGEINTFLGFRFIMMGTGFLPKTGNIRSCFAWHRPGLLLATGIEPSTHIAERPDKAFSKYVYVNQTLGATRMEELRVIQIDCDETEMAAGS